MIDLPTDYYISKLIICFCGILDILPPVSKFDHTLPGSEVGVFENYLRGTDFVGAVARQEYSF